MIHMVSAFSGIIDSVRKDVKKSESSDDKKQNKEKWQCVSQGEQHRNQVRID